MCEIIQFPTATARLDPPAETYLEMSADQDLRLVRINGAMPPAMALKFMKLFDKLASGAAR